jgi:hypothetical protein
VTFHKKIKSVYETLQPIDSDPMLNFDERDLLELVEDTGFKNIHLTLKAEIVRNDDLEWDVLLKMAGNPRIPTLAARGESPTAFGRRCIPADCVAPPSNIPDILGRRALLAGRLAALGATPDFHHGLLDEAMSKSSR